MSAEDRITKIENLLFALTENQVKAGALAAIHQQEAAIRQQETLERNARVDKEMAAMRESLDRHVEFVVKAMDRTDQQLAESAKQLTATASAQKATELQLQKFINKVDGIDDRVTKLELKKP